MVIKKTKPENKKSKTLAKKYKANKTASETNSMITEPVVIYGKKHSKHQRSLSAFSLNGILIDAVNKPENQMTSFEKMDALHFGVSKKDLENLKATARLDYDKLAKALSVTRATLINKKGQEKFNASLSERIISLADIYSYGYEVFENEERFNRWMFKPNRALGGKTPYELIDNQFGREEVRNIIGRIDYGVYS